MRLNNFVCVDCRRADRGSPRLPSRKPICPSCKQPMQWWGRQVPKRRDDRGWKQAAILLAQWATWKYETSYRGAVRAIGGR